MREEIAILLVSGGLSAALCAALLPLLKRARAGQYILGYVREHKSKSGTPTMGGLAFVCAAALAAIPFGLYADRHVAVAVTFGCAYAAVGFLDDFLKLRRRSNLGLRAYQKILFQLAVAARGAVLLHAGLTELHLPCRRGGDVGVWIVPLAAFAFVAATNCVNLTDGLDGLAASVLLVFCCPGGADLPPFGEAGVRSRGSLILCGVLAGYLLFNSFPLRVHGGYRLARAGRLRRGDRGAERQSAVYPAARRHVRLLGHIRHPAGHIL